jgi:competence protein ComEA
MKPSIWKTVPPRIVERTSGFLALLLILLMVHVLKPARNAAPSPVFFCRDPLYIQVEGEVTNPGVYPFSTKPCIEEVIRKAGGVRVGCESYHANRDTILTSGQKVLLIREVQECRVFLGEMSARHKISLSIPLSVNKESQEGLTAIPGIGFNLAGTIVREREKRGGFKSLDEIAGVPGVGKAIYRKMKPYLSL